MRFLYPLRHRRHQSVAVALCVVAGLAGSLVGQSYKVLGWNDLGMHCMDSDYAVFSILPPYNDIQAQVLDGSGNLLHTSLNLTLTYEAVADPTGSINTTSAGKTNYWTYTAALYGGSSVPDTGLAGHNMPGPGNTPQGLAFDAAESLFHANGVPLTPYDDAGHKRTYPLMRLVARNASGTELGHADVVLPISDEMDCSVCHASGSGNAARPAAGWVYDRNQIHDYRLNILRLHDEKQAGNPAYGTALTAAGYDHNGLYANVTSGAGPILCAACHASNALPGTGQPGLSPLTSAVHAGHAPVIDPLTGMPLQASANRSSCYRCHPGSDTRCLRGAMGSAVDPTGSRAMQCQSCHGSMAEVGNPQRAGWLDEPSCQSCHTGTALANNGRIRYTSVFESNGQVRQAVDATFATESNVPAAGFSLYRFSSGHGGLRCEACHGSTHAVYPSAHGNDNIEAEALQGHAGTLVECSACHGKSPSTVTGGPHGMHPVGQRWVNAHGDIAENGRYQQCRTCHGTDYRGTVLSTMHADRTLQTPWGQKALFRGARVSCYACHRGPTNDDPNSNRRPTAANASAITATAPVTIPLSASDPDNNPLTLRIVSQPAFGRVALSGTTATYYPEPGFAGPDRFTFAAWDGSIDSNLATVTVNRLSTWLNYGTGYPGTAGTVPALSLDAPPKLGTTPTLAIGNSSGTSTAAVLVLSTERASLVTAFGGLLLTELDTALPLQLPAAGTGVAVPVPNLPSLSGVSVYTQAIQADNGARFTLAFTPGLCMTLGQ